MVDPFYKYFKEKLSDKIDDSDESLISTVNVATYFLANVIEKSYWRYTKELNIPADKRSIIAMKNEFFYKRLMLTRNKKQYGGIIKMKEGNLLEKPKTDIKGLSIRKVSVNYNLREYFTNILEESVLKSEKIDLGVIFGNYVKIQKEIANSLKSGNITYSLPAKVNEIESYKFPYRIMSVRGAIIWNELFPENEIVYPTKVNILKLKINSLEDIADKIPMEQYEIIKNTIFDNENLAHHGFTALSMPKDATEIPEWLVPFIDIEEMVNAHVKNGIIILESLGFKTLDVLKYQFPTNVLKF